MAPWSDIVELSARAVNEASATTDAVAGQTASNLRLFFILHIVGGHVALPIVLLLAWSRETVGRTLVFHNFIFSWILYSMSFSLLLYANRHTGPEPDRGLCMAQASLVYATPVLTATALWCLVFQLWLDLRSPKPMGKSYFTWKSVTLLVVPYLAALTFMIVPAVIGAVWPTSVSRANSFFFCSSKKPGLSIASAGTVLAITAAVVVLVVLIGVKMRQYRSLHQNRINQGWVQAHFYMRALAFTCYLVLTLAASGLAIFDPQNVARVIIQATGPLAVFLVFGTSPDLYKATSSDTF